jgi:hypothetical protein
MVAFYRAFSAKTSLYSVPRARRLTLGFILSSASRLKSRIRPQAPSYFHDIRVYSCPFAVALFNPRLSASICGSPHFFPLRLCAFA